MKEYVRQSAKYIMMPGYAKLRHPVVEERTQKLKALCKALGINRVRVVDPYDLKACEEAVLEELAAEEPSVIISRRPCVLLKYVKPQMPLTVDRDKCRGCKKCMKMGCPSISFRDGKARIDRTLCVGCGVCEQLCAFGAIGGNEDERCR